MAVLHEVTRIVPVKTLKPLQMHGGTKHLPKAIPAHRKVLDPLKTKRLPRPAQGNNSLTST